MPMDGTGLAHFAAHEMARRDAMRTPDEVAAMLELKRLGCKRSREATFPGAV